MIDRNEAANALFLALMRCQTILGNMAQENEGVIFNRWPINHEPLRADARALLPDIVEALEGYALTRPTQSAAAPEPVAFAAALPSGALFGVKLLKDSAIYNIPLYTHPSPSAATSGEKKQLCAALTELRDMVMGECPNLLDGDRGGSGRLALEIEALLKEEKDR